jgi:hypothetical protein
MRVCKFKVKRSDRQTNAFLRRCLVSMGVARDWRMNWNRRIYGMTVRRSCRQRRQIPRAHYDCDTERIRFIRAHDAPRRRGDMNKEHERSHVPRCIANIGPLPPLREHRQLRQRPVLHRRKEVQALV